MKFEQPSLSFTNSLGLAPAIRALWNVTVDAPVFLTVTVCGRDVERYDARLKTSDGGEIFTVEPEAWAIVAGTAPRLPSTSTAAIQPKRAFLFTVSPQSHIGAPDTIRAAAMVRIGSLAYNEYL